MGKYSQGGMSDHVEYGTWYMMNYRCHNPKSNTYHTYGAIGITVCERWRQSFSRFLSDMGSRPEGMTLERKDNSKGYGPKNCRWATPAEQNRNTRRNVAMDIDGCRYVMKDVAAALGFNEKILRHRVKKGMTLECAVRDAVLTRPIAA